MAIEDEVQVLANLPLFAGADSAALKLLAFSSELITFLEGDVLFHQGDPSQAAYVLLSGVADVRVAGAGGPVTVAVLKAHQIVGEMGVLTGAARSATVLARTRIEALAIPAETLNRLLATSSPVALGFVRELARRIERSNALIAAMAPAG